MKLRYPEFEKYHSYSTEFPRHCESCSRIYKDVEDYLKHTLPFLGHTTPDGNLFESHDLTYRLCECGKLMVINLKSRRDRTTEGVARRKYFQHLLNLLTNKEIDRNLAQTHLRSIFGKDIHIHPPSHHHHK